MCAVGGLQTEGVLAGGQGQFGFQLALAVVQMRLVFEDNFADRCAISIHRYVQMATAVDDVTGWLDGEILSAHRHF